jgi:hypothetical protein
VQVVVEIENVEGNHAVWLSVGGERMALSKLALGEQARVTIKHQAFSLGDLVKALIRYDSDDLKLAYDERGQLEIGRYLSSPRMLVLVVAPEPAGVARIRAEAHLETLENRLSGADRRLSRHRHLRVAETWEDFQALASDFEPQIVY